MKNLILLLTVVLFCRFDSPALTTEKAHTPIKQSAERGAILDALSGDKHLIFRVHFLKVHDGWAWIDATPLEARTKWARAEGGTPLLHSENGKWRVTDLSKVAEDAENPVASQDASRTFVRNLRKIFPDCPADIFLNRENKFEVSCKRNSRPRKIRAG